MITRRQFFQGTIGLFAIAALSRSGLSRLIVEDPPPRIKSNDWNQYRIIIKVAQGGTLPLGTVFPHIGDIPVGWLPCDGRLIARSSFPDLYDVMPRDRMGKSMYGEIGFGKKFHLPDMRGRLAL